MSVYLDFEKPLAAIEGEIRAMQEVIGESRAPELKAELRRLQEKARAMLGDLYDNLTPWQKTQVARHPRRPHCLDYIADLMDEFTPLAGDRLYAEDHAIIAGVGRFCGRSLVVLGQEKGHDMESRMKHNFGMARPEGYRKAMRMMDLAEKFSMPIVSFVDTAGAYPGIGAEERGQSEAIARSIDRSLSLRVPNIAIVIGEGGSGGALAIAAANRVFMLEHAIYTVASPEACASILWRDPASAKSASQALKITAEDLLDLGVIDGIVEEPLGGAHRGRAQTIALVGDLLDKELRQFDNVSPARLSAERKEKFLAMGRDVPIMTAAMARRRKALKRGKSSRGRRFRSLKTLKR